jgi:hypothetical protein
VGAEAMRHVAGLRSEAGLEFLLNGDPFNSKNPLQTERRLSIDACWAPAISILSECKGFESLWFVLQLGTKSTLGQIMLNVKIVGGKYLFH